MKLEERGVSNTVGGNFETNSFSIQMSAHAFRTLSDTLYTNKERAVIREVTCNAEDGRARAGSTRPCDVHLPTKFEPWFSVRDYGCSMTHDQVMRRYTTYFDSDKNDSNQEIGGFGLGCKSPFALSDSFTVERFKDGQHGIYNAFISGDGIPQIAKVGEDQPTTEPDGIKVHVPVKLQDSFVWEREAAFVYATFEVTPNVINCKTFAPEDITIDSVVDDPKFLISKVVGVYRNKHWLVMGGVRYEVPNELIPQELSHYYYSTFVKADIGDVSIAPNRESLSIDKKTEDFLKEGYKRALKILVAEYQEKVDKCANSWDFATLVEEVIPNHFKTAIDLTKKPSHFKDSSYKMRLEFNSIKRGMKNPLGFIVEATGAHTFRSVDAMDRKSKGTFFVVDNATHYKKKIKWYIEENDLSYRDCYVIKTCDSLSRFKKEVLKDCPWPFVKTSSITVPKSASVKSTYVPQVYHYSKIQDSPAYIYSVETNFGLSKGGYYVVSFNRDTKHSIEKYSQTVDLFTDQSSFVVVPKTGSKKFVDHPDWKDLDDYIEEEVEKEKPKYLKAALIARQQRYLSNSKAFFSRIKKGSIDSLIVEHLFKVYHDNLLSKLEEVERSLKSKPANFVERAGYFYGKDSWDLPGFTESNFVSIATSRYPMLKGVIRSRYYKPQEPSTKEVKEYLQLMDAQRAALTNQTTTAKLAA